MKKQHKIVQFLPAIFALIASIVTIIICLVVMHRNSPIRLIQACIAPLIPLVIPLVNKVFKIRIPFVLNVFVAIHSVLALDCAAALNFYAYTGFDKFLHTCFGFLGAAVMFVIMYYFNGDRMNKAGFYIFLLLAVLGIGAIWEIWEYSSDAILGTVCQCWQPAVSEYEQTVGEYFKSYNPMTDTMWDLIVTIFGTLAFYLFLLIDKLFGGKVYKSIVTPIQEDKQLKKEKQAKEENPAAQ